MNKPKTNIYPSSSYYRIIAYLKIELWGCQAELVEAFYTIDLPFDKLKVTLR